MLPNTAPYPETKTNLGRYVCEISPPSKRGPLASAVQLFITFGLMLGYFIAYGTNNISSSLAWRLPLAIQAGMGAILAVAAHFYLPPSPRWLAYKGRKEEAVTVWEKLGVLAAEREKDILQNPTVGEPELLAATSSTGGGLVERVRRNVIESAKMFGKDSRKQMLLGVFMMSMQQLSGIDGVLYVSFSCHPYRSYLTLHSTHPFSSSKQVLLLQRQHS